MSEKEKQNTGKKSKIKTFFKVLGITLAVILFLVLILRDILVKHSVEQIGSFVTGTPVEVGHFSTSLAGRVELKNFAVGNPAGYQSPHAIKLKEVVVDIDLASLFTDRIKINLIRVDGMKIDFESGLGKSNLGDILDNVNRLSGGQNSDAALEQSEEPAAEKESEPGEAKKVEITELAIVNNGISFSNKALGVSVPVPLGGIVLENIGKEDDVSMVEAVNLIMIEVFNSVVTACGQAGMAVGDVLVDVTDQAATAAADAAAQATKAASEAAAEATKAATDAVGNVSESAVKAIDSIGKGTAEVLDDTAKEAAGALKNLLKLK